jgi:hypothetical protein
VKLRSELIKNMQQLEMKRQESHWVDPLSISGSTP